MSEELGPQRDPPTPDRQGIDSGTWIWIGIALLAALALIVWGAYAGLPSRGPP